MKNALTIRSRKNNYYIILIIYSIMEKSLPPKQRLNGNYARFQRTEELRPYNLRAIEFLRPKRDIKIFQLTYYAYARD